MDGPLGLVSWWHLEAVANAAICVSYLTIAALIAKPLLALKQLGQNKLATTAAAIFFTCAIAHGGEALQPGFDSAGSPWWLALWDLCTALVAVYYLTLRRSYGNLLGRGPLFEDLLEKERVTGLERLAVASAGRDQAETQRDHYAHMLRSIIENNQSAIYAKDLEGRYLLVNRKLAEIMGRPVHEILGQTDHAIDPELAPLWRANDVQAQAGSFGQQEQVDTYPDGRHYFDLVKFPLFDDAGALYATCGISTDVTEQKRAVVTLTEARDAAVAANVAKSTFLATMSHELRTPINAVIGMTDLLIDTELDDRQTELAEMVGSGGHALLAVINDVLDYSKIESGALLLESASFDLADEIEGSLQLVAAAAAAKELDLVCYVDQSCPSRVSGDSFRLRQIVANLLSNAVKFTEVGEVFVTVAALPSEDVRLELSISVADTGIGIETAGLEALFRSFSQVDASTTRVYGGTGLGLAISQRLAEAMEGRLEVTSTPGVGSIFTAIVRVDRLPDVPTIDEAARAATPELAGKSVVLVDDNATNLRILDLKLTSVGMTCTGVSSPSEALALVREGSTYDLAVLDMHMPEMDGAELGRALKKAGPRNLPLILLANVGTRPGGDEETFASCLTKPAKSAALREALSSALIDRLPSANRRSGIGTTVWAPPQNLRILLAEDNRVNQRVAELMLEKLGYGVDIVANGHQAVEAVKKVLYDVVLMDVQMPQLDGLEATRRIRAQVPANNQPHIVAMTASAFVEDRVACADAGMDAYLAKPVRAAELRAALGDLHATKRTSANDADTRIDEPPTAMDDPPVDESVLIDLMEQVGGNGQDMRDDLIQSYLDESLEQVQQLAEAARAFDAATVASIAHSLRSTSAMVGARRLVLLLLHVEQVARTTPGNVPSVKEAVTMEYERVAAALRDLLTREILPAAP